MSGFRIVVADKDEIYDYDDFVCPKCDEEKLVNRFKLSDVTIWKGLSVLAFVVGLLVGGML